MKNYIAFIRSYVGHRNIFLNYAVGVIFNKEGKILLQKRSDTGNWGLPGGAIELGESLEDAAIREVYEETGLKVSVKKLLGIYSHPKYTKTYSNGDKNQPIVVAYYCKFLGGSLKITDKETLDLKYFSITKLPKITGLQHKNMINDALSAKTHISR